MSTEHYSTIFERLASSTFRARFKLGTREHAYLESKGMDTIRSHALDFITTRLAPTSPVHDGKQTPMRGHPVFIAQHATATCCRKCLMKWHTIPKGRPLDEGEIAFVVNLVMAWIERQTAD